VIDEAASAELQTRAREVRSATDEPSMRILELVLAGMALIAAVLLTVVR
jgi:hypothetical protein